MCACVLLSLARNICFIIKGVTSVIPASLWNMFLHYTNSSVYLSRFYKEKLRLKRLLFIWIWICFLFSFVQKAGAERVAVNGVNSNKTEKSWSGISPFFLYYRDDTIYSIASVSITNFTLPSIPLSFPLNVV